MARGLQEVVSEGTQHPLASDALGATLPAPAVREPDAVPVEGRCQCRHPLPRGRHGLDNGWLPASLACVAATVSNHPAPGGRQHGSAVAIRLVDDKDIGQL